MSKIFFFCIPAHGHTNPTLPVVAELVRRGHEVRYYSFEEFREKITATGAKFVACDSFLPPVSKKETKRLLKVSTTEMTVKDFETTARIDPMLCKDIEREHPDCIVADSVCFWGKLIAQKYALPFVCSVTTFAFNRYSSQYMKNSFGELMDMILGIPRMNRALRKLQPLGYHVKNALSIVQNDNDTDTVVYTSRKFQPCADTFSDHYAFVGPTALRIPVCKENRKRPLIYVSLGTVVNNHPEFYQNCIEALQDMDADVVMSCGRYMDLDELGELPPHIKAYAYTNQLQILAEASIFVTHCGMNSVSESLLSGVPMVMVPQTGEEAAVARRTCEVGAGLLLKEISPKTIRTAVNQILTQNSYAKAAEAMRADFLSCPGAAGAAHFIEKKAGEKNVWKKKDEKTCN